MLLAHAAGICRSFSGCWIRNPEEGQFLLDSPFGRTRPDVMLPSGQSLSESSGAQPRHAIPRCSAQVGLNRAKPPAEQDTCDMARRAILLHEGSLAERECRLGRVLDFFGVPWKPVSSTDLHSLTGDNQDCAAFGAVRAISKVFRMAPPAFPAVPRFAAV